MIRDVVLPMVTAVVAQFFDLGTFIEMVRRYGPHTEANPLVAALFRDFGTPAVAFAKAALLLFVVALAVCATQRQTGRVRVVASALPIAVAIVAGLVGGISNARVILG